MWDRAIIIWGAGAVGGGAHKVQSGEIRQAAKRARLKGCDFVGSDFQINEVREVGEGIGRHACDTVATLWKGW